MSRKAGTVARMETLGLILAGVAGGLANALAGGGSLLTFPALMAVGLPPLVANATNALAVSPAHPMAAWAQRSELPPAATLRPLLLAALLGGALGAGLLLATPARFFEAMVPALIGLPTLLFAAGGAIQRALGGTPGWRPHRAMVLLLPCAAYGGYFGAGLGIMLMAMLRLAGEADAHRANALKNLLASAAVLAGLVILTGAGLIAWGPMLAVLAGSVLGGWAGGRLAGRIPAGWLRGGIITAGTGMTGFYAWRLWL